MSCMFVGNEQRVVEMMRLGYRSAIIRTTVPSVTWLRLRRIARHLGVQKMDRGPLPTSRRLLRTAKSCLGGSTLMTIYETLHSNANTVVDIAALEKALLIYSGIRADYRSLGEYIDNNAAWVLARDLRSTDVFWADCSCGFRYLIANDSLRPDVCPACVTQKNTAQYKQKKNAARSMLSAATDNRFTAHVALGP